MLEEKTCKQALCQLASSESQNLPPFECEFFFSIKVNTDQLKQAMFEDAPQLQLKRLRGPYVGLKTVMVRNAKEKS